MSPDSRLVPRPGRTPGRERRHPQLPILPLPPSLHALAPHPVRLLHLADAHLDTLFRGRNPETRRRLREASRQALSAAFRKAREARVDAVLMAGDLFDSTRLSLATEAFLLREVEGLLEAGIPFLYATGNHDPGEDGGGTGRIRWPEGVERFAGPEPRTVVIHREGRPVGTVTGAGHPTARESRDLSRAFPAPAPGGLPAVALLHTQVGGARGNEAHERYAPSELGHLREAGFDYWALGHIHLRQALVELPGIHYPGNPQGRNPRETGAKGGLLVEIPGRGSPPQVSFSAFAPLRWERLELSRIEALATAPELVDALRTAWEEARRDDPGLPRGEWIVRVVLSGPSPLHAPLRDPAEVAGLEEVLARELGALEVELRAEGVRPQVRVEEALERQDAAGEALRLARALLAREGPPPSEALGVKAEALAGRPAEMSLDAYLRELLAGADVELLALFLEGGEGEGA